MSLPALALTLVTAVCLTGIRGQDAPDRRARLRAVGEEIQRLEDELRELRARESGLLGELERLQAEIRLRSVQRERAGIEIEELSEAIDRVTSRLEELERQQLRRRRYLSFRLREMYKAGPQQILTRVIGGQAVEAYLHGVRYAAQLGARDRRVLSEFRGHAARLLEERRELEQRNAELRRLDREQEESGKRLAATRAERSRLLVALREDAGKREAALEELRQASAELARVIDSARGAAAAPQLDVHRFRGLLDWPAPGSVTSGFGSFVHPRFKTRVPHPGLDIDAAAGADIRSVFDGRVVFASWMRGYGLTAILDHGGGLLSVYAHASALLVEPGEDVLRGQLLGLVGETGSLRGPFLYFELREDGRPVDPEQWLRPG